MHALLVDRVFELFAHNLLVFSHFVAAAFALTALLRIDVRLLLALRKPLPAALLDDLNRVERVVLISLGLLYASGVLFILNGVSANPQYLSNEKLQAKILIVAALTLNGFLVHGIGHKLKSGDVVASLPFSRRMEMAAVAAVSCTSWLWACFLGIARNWNFKMQLAEIALLYGISVLLMLAVIATVMAMASPMPASEMTLRPTVRRKPRHFEEVSYG